MNVSAYADVFPEANVCSHAPRYRPGCVVVE